MTPQPRPALRRADDASVHPALALAPSQAPPTTFTSRTDEVQRPTSGSPAGTSGASAAQPPRDRRFRGPGRATSDSLRATKSKKVKLQVQVPKTIRKQLRSVAKASGMSPDELVTEALTDWLGDPRRW